MSWQALAKENKFGMQDALGPPGSDAIWLGLVGKCILSRAIWVKRVGLS